MSTEPPPTLDYERDKVAGDGVMSQVVVVLLSVVPGLASVLLHGRRRLLWSVLLLATLGATPIAAMILPVALFPYPSVTARYWSEFVLEWGVPAGLLVLSIRQGLRDRADVTATGGTPAYRQRWRGVWPVAVVLMMIAIIVVILSVGLLIAFGGFSAAK